MLVIYIRLTRIGTTISQELLLQVLFTISYYKSCSVFTAIKSKHQIPGSNQDRTEKDAEAIIVYNQYDTASLPLSQQRLQLPIAKNSKYFN